MVHLQLVKAVRPHQIADPGDIGGFVEPLAQNRGEHGLACAMRHRGHGRSDRDERGSFAFAPADDAAGLDAHEERVLAAIPDVENLGH